MKLAILAAAAFTLAESILAIPLLNLEMPEVSKLAKRTMPISTHWDMIRPNAEAQRDKAISATTEAILLARIVHLKPDKKRWDTILRKYFQESEQKAVEQVFQYMSGATPDHPDGVPEGSDYLGGIVMVDYQALRSDKGDCEDSPDGILAWISNSQAGPPNRALMRICDAGQKIPLYDDTKCQDLGDKVSGKMNLLGGVILHEFRHFDAIGKRARGERIQDHGDSGYGPLNTRNFNTDRNVPSSNADSYRWFAQEFYWSYYCQKDFGDPTDNWDYVKCKDGAGKESTCTIQ